MKYAMDGALEFDRLQEQAKQKNYSLESELAFFHFEDNTHILDAGCGSGVLIDYLLEMKKKIQITGIDFSDIRVQQLKKKYLHCASIQNNNIEKLTIKDHSFDHVFCRYVLEHLEKPQQAINELSRVLKKGGKLCVIDLDGILFNLHTEDETLKEQLKQLKQNFNFDFFIGRKIASMMEKANLINIRWTVVPMVFQEEDLENELKNYQQRFELGREFVEKILGKTRTDFFFKRYLEELKSGKVFFYNKFLVEGTKP